MATKLPAIGETILRLESVDSTNNVLAEMVRNGQARPGTVVMADVQTSGRGRVGRTWNAEPGTALLLSIHIPCCNTTIAYAPASLAAQSAIAEFSPVRPVIKWPNDILIEGKKVCGILIAVCGQGMIVGMGINVNMDAAHLDRIGPEATSILHASGKPVDTEMLLALLLQSVREQFEKFADDSDAVFREWRAALATIGQVVEVQTARETWIGQAIDVAPDGSLLVERNNEVVPVFAADVRIRMQCPKQIHIG